MNGFNTIVSECLIELTVRAGEPEGFELKRVQVIYLVHDQGGPCAISYRQKWKAKVLTVMIV